MTDNKKTVKVEAELPTERYDGNVLKQLFMKGIEDKGKNDFKELLEYFNKYFYKAADGKGYYHYIVEEEYYEERKLWNDTSRFEKLDQKNLDTLVFSLLNDPRIEDSEKYAKKLNCC